MSELSTVTDIEEALQRCADEPAHTPGLVQPFGCLLAASHKDKQIEYASANLEDFIGTEARQALGQDLRDILGGEAWHALNNALSQSDIEVRPIETEFIQINGRFLDMRVFKSPTHLIVELEPDLDSGLGAPESMKTLTYLMGEIQKAKDEEQLFELSAQLLKDLSGYDRCLIYRFDTSFNGEVVSEAARFGMESFRGLHFPHWDIPAQARALMAKLPMRFCVDVDHPQVPILSAPSCPPLDITYATLRGTSPVHMAYLRNMDVAATMTLNVKADDRLWGMISFHHRKPKVPTTALRTVLKSFLSIFEGKLLALQNQKTLDRIQSLDMCFSGNAAETQPIELLVPAAGPEILKVMNAHGFCALTSAGITTFGDVPDLEVLTHLTDLSMQQDDTLLIDSLSEQFPEFAGKFGSSVGCLLTGLLPDRSVGLFRKEPAEGIAWAGNPEKKIELVDGEKRLSPRASFSAFLDEKKGKCAPWTASDAYLLEHLRTLLQAAERQDVMDTLNRQQALMIGELNHRVRNILALVRSVSRQARRRYGSLNSYANAIENRVRALAAAHDISQGRVTEAVSIKHLLSVEFEPFNTFADRQTVVQGDDVFLLPTIAPIVSLVFHELTTNAVKYGALSVPAGKVRINIVAGSDGLQIKWQETDGPAVKMPNERGFGLAMIEQAIPHELSGTAKLTFDETGFSAAFLIPDQHLGQIENGAPRAAHPSNPIMPDEIEELPQKVKNGTVLLLEDNFIIAKEMADELRDAGIQDVAICSSKAQALETLEDLRPSLAILDINLGLHETSEQVALHILHLGVPMIFVTGYGEAFDLAPELEGITKMVKPISSAELAKALQALDL